MEYNWIVEFFLVAVFLLSLLLLNHSCDPNIFTTIIDSNRIAVLANLPIKTSLQFFIENSSQFYSSDMKNYQELQIMSETKKAWENYWNWKLWSRVKSECRQPLNVPAGKNNSTQWRRSQESQYDMQAHQQDLPGFSISAKVWKKHDNIVKKLCDFSWRQCEIMCYPVIQDIVSLILNLPVEISINLGNEKRIFNVNWPDRIVRSSLFTISM